MGVRIKRFMWERGLRINWLADQIGMKPKTLYPKLDGSRAIFSDELTKINAVLGTAFEGEKDAKTR